jgi:hypothetical protein
LPQDQSPPQHPRRFPAFVQHPGNLLALLLGKLDMHPMVGSHGHSDPELLMQALRQAAMKRHRQHVANIHRNYGRDIGLVSKRGTVKLRYAPNDSLLKTLLFANVDKRIELNDFLSKLEMRYGIVFGDREAEHVLPKGDFDKKAFRANSRRLEQRLGSLGVLKRLSDACAYVINPYLEETP